jgi:ketosteroid isomerase-like protein
MKTFLLLLALVPTMVSASTSVRLVTCAQYKAKLEKIFTAKMSGDIATFMGAMSDGIEWEMEGATLPWGGKYVGKTGEKGLEGFFGKVGAMQIDAHSWKTVQFTCDRANRRVVVQGIEGLHSLKDPKKTADFNVIEVWQFGVDGQITSLHGFLDSAKLTETILQ